MPLDRLQQSLEKELKQLEKEGRSKIPERIIKGYTPSEGDKGFRYFIEGYDCDFIRMNSNSYMALSHHPEVTDAADKATHKYGVGPGAVRFIDGTHIPHISLEKDIAKFVEKPSAKIFNSAYTSNLALALAINTSETFWIGDELNHNSIIRAMRISGVPRTNKAIYKHNDMLHLKQCLESVPKNMKRVCVIFDGIFSMRGDCAFIQDIQSLVNSYSDNFEEGIISIVDDSHGIGAFGKTGRGAIEYSGVSADIIIGTFGKAFGVNGGFIAGSEVLTEVIRQKSDTYIYTNPLSPADCAAASKAIEIIDSPEGIKTLKALKECTQQFRSGIENIGYESIDGPHPIVPILVRDTQKTHALVKHLLDNGILVVGLTFPVVPKGSETIRVQINAGHTKSDIDYALDIIAQFKA